MDGMLKELVGMIVADSAYDALNEFLNTFEEQLDNEDHTVEVSQLKKGDQICVIKFETEKAAMALVHKDGKYAIDVDSRDPNSGLVPITKEHFDKLMDRSNIIKNKYSKNNVIVTSDLEDTYAGGERIPDATQEQEDAMLDTCLKVIDTLDGREQHYNNLSHKSFGHVTIVEADDDFLLALTCKGDSVYVNTNPDDLPCRYSPSVSEAMRMAFKMVNEKLPNSLPAHMKMLLPLVSARFNSMTNEEKRKAIEQLRNRKR